MTTTDTVSDLDPPAKASVAPERPAPSADPYRSHVIGASVILTATLPAILALMVLGRPKPPPPAWSVEAAALGVEPREIALGETTFLSACALCHGRSGEGIPRLGKPLRNSAFVQGTGDAELLDLLVNGRLPTDPANTSGTLMPSRGAQGIDDARLAAVVTFLRAIQDPNAPTVSVEAWNTKTLDGADGEQVAGGPEVGGVGYDLFIASCSACHGARGEGMEGLGKPLKGSDFVASKSDAELLAFVKSGRPVWDAENTTGIDMPPKGGNPALTDDQIADIIAHIRTLQQ
ncbi:MAG TPA: c-type cytochrome [Phycisphaerales bacterium]|nr:c-type cytochrome [Phycisphaerales bacterium]